MEIFLKIIQGSYAYLLIFQILVVSMLFLALVWLVIRRTQEAAAMASAPSFTPAPVDAVQMAAPPLVAPAPQPIVVTGVPQEEFNKVKAELDALKRKTAVKDSKP